MLYGITVKKSDNFRKHLQFMDSGLASFTSGIVSFAGLFHTDLQRSNFFVECFFKILKEKLARQPVPLID
jgi:hypothetical protein